MKPESESWAHYLAGAVGRYAESAKAEIERLRTDVERLDAALAQQMEDADRLRAALREIRALHEPEWASEQAKASGKEPWVCSLCGTADGLWPCSTVATIREVLGDE